jgi:hypothetical protein
MGELTNLTSEFRGTLDELIGYCKEKYLPVGVSYDIDSVAEEVLR